MAARTIVRGRYVVCRITGRDSAEIARDGAALVEGGAIVEVGRSDELRGRFPDAEVVGSDRHALIPGSGERSSSRGAYAVSDGRLGRAA